MQRLKLSPQKKKFCDKLLNETDNASKACLEVFPHLTPQSASMKAHRMINKDENVIAYLESHSHTLQENLVKLAYSSRSDNVKLGATINALDRILGKPIGSEKDTMSSPTIQVVNFVNVLPDSLQQDNTQSPPIAPPIVV